MKTGTHVEYIKYYPGTSSYFDNSTCVFIWDPSSCGHLNSSDPWLFVLAWRRHISKWSGTPQFICEIPGVISKLTDRNASGHKWADQWSDGMFSTVALTGRRPLTISNPPPPSTPHWTLKTAAASNTEKVLTQCRRQDRGTFLTLDLVK